MYTRVFFFNTNLNKISEDADKFDASKNQVSRSGRKIKVKK